MKTRIFIILSAAVIISACKKLVVVDSPPTKFDSSKAYSTDGNATGVLTSIYQEMSNNGVAQGIPSISFIAGVSADELTDYQFNGELTAAYQNKLSAFNVPFWGRLYFLIYTSNTAIQGLTTSTTLTPAVKQRLLGEAKFVRAFLYFYLVNLWGDVPLLLTNDYNANNIASRSSTDLVYKQIITDLVEAQDLLGPDYLLSDLRTVTTDRIRPNKWAAKALLARAYLYSGNYEGAARLSSEIIENKTVFDFTSLSETFLKSSKEAIWQIQPISTVWNTYDARAFILREAPNVFQPVSLSNQLMSAFEIGDGRQQSWVGTLVTGNKTYYYANKYKSYQDNAGITEYLMVLRLSEQYLIRAEAKVKLGDLPGAISDINAIRRRSRLPISDDIPAPLPDISASASSSSLMSYILHERQVELFTEWGHRWFDLKRSGEINDVMKVVSPLKGGTWDANRALFPIPLGDIRVNTNLTQNPGY